jgi:hypothetical protein
MNIGGPCRQIGVGFDGHEQIGLHHEMPTPTPIGAGASRFCKPKSEVSVSDFILQRLAGRWLPFQIYIDWIASRLSLSSSLRCVQIFRLLFLCRAGLSK